MKMKILRFATLSMACVLFIGAAILQTNNVKAGFGVDSNPSNDDEQGFKVRIVPVIKEDVGVTANDIKAGLKGLLASRGNEIVEEGGADVVDFYVVVGRLDGDEDNDGVTDCNDPDANGDNIPDNKEDIEVIDIDAVAPNVVKGLPNTDSESGIYMYAYTNADKANIIKLVMKADSLKKDEKTAYFPTENNARLFQNASFSPRQEYQCANDGMELGGRTVCKIWDVDVQQMRNGVESRQKKIESLEKQVNCLKTLVSNAKKTREFDFDGEKHKCEALAPPSAPRLMSGVSKRPR